MRLPIVKLDIDYDDRTSRFVVNQEDLTVSPDGSEVSIRYDTVERICRASRRIDKSVHFDLMYWNEKEELVKLPKQLQITKENAVSVTTRVTNLKLSLVNYDTGQTLIKTSLSIILMRCLIKVKAFQRHFE